jgi:predicted Zn-dependent peptidase
MPQPQTPANCHLMTAKSLRALYQLLQKKRFSEILTKIQLAMSRSILTLLAALFLSAVALAQPAKTVTKTSANGKYSWQEVEGDPTGVRFYTLKNGLTVIIAENRLEPRIMTLFVTKAGSKQDPADNTGLAHYLEHMLFKGTDRFGSLDYEKEKVQLDRIEALYEVYNRTTDPSQRKAIYQRIDSVSNIAAKYAIANEYDKLMSSIGSNMTNAFTSFENTTYMENIPSNNLEKYLIIQRERLRQPVLRLFHTELEAVYEEKNIGLDNGSRKVFEAMFGSLFKKHPYGTQTVIGTIEHLKNPSLTAIRNYYDTYYVPNNMAMILTGDLDPDQAIAMVDQHFSNWQAKPVPPLNFEPEAPRTAIEEVSVFSPDEEQVAIGFVMPSALSEEAVLADLVSAILYNGKSGLIDQNLVKQQKVLEAYGFNYLLKDYGIIYFGGKPLDGQSMATVKDLIIEQVNNLKKGNFDQSLIQATVNNLKVSRIQEQENAMNMAFVLHDQFVVGKPWAEYLAGVEAMSRITKEDVVRFANKWFGDNYTVVYKKSGEDPNVQKVEKPEINPVEVNREAQSDFFKDIVESPSKPLAPVFLDYDKDIQKAELQRDLPIWAVNNEINELFTLYYVLDMGNDHNKKLPLAIDYLQFIGTSTMTNEQINKELYQLAVNLDIFSSNDQVYVSLSGLQENFAPAVKILEALLNDPKPDQEALDKMIASKIKARNDATLNKRAIFWQALGSYTSYGADNPFNDVLSNQEMRQIKAQELTDIIRSIPAYKHRIYYYGPKSLDAFKLEMKSLHQTPAKLMDYPAEKKYTRQIPSENTIYLVDYDMVQAEIGLRRWDADWDPAMVPLTSAFNEYYGGGMGSVVFQDIRESKALAYSAFATYSRPSKASDPFSSLFYVGTQADKLSDAMSAVQNLLDNMPESEQLWEVGKRSIKQGIETRRVTKTSILFNYQNALRLGVDHDMRRDIYEAVDNISLADIKKFHQEHMSGKNWSIALIGSKDKLDLEALKPYGKVVELSLKDVFGYEVEKTVRP